MAFLNDDATSVSTMPTPSAVGTPGWFTDGNPSTGIPATIVQADCLNSMLAETQTFLTAAGIAPLKTNNGQLLAAMKILFRQQLQANTTFYVATTGSDTTGNGLTSGTPWQTIQKAINVVQCDYDLNGFVATIQLANGTYVGAAINGGFTGSAAGNAGVIISGGTTAGTVVTQAGTNLSTFACTQGGTIQLQNMTITNNGTAPALVWGQNSGFVINTGFAFGACPLGPHMQGSNAGCTLLIANYTINGSSPYHLSLGTNAVCGWSAITVTLTGTPAFSGAFINISTGAVASVGTSAWSGSATGTRYNIVSNGVMVSGQSTTWLPGSVAGSTLTGGQYV